MNRKAIKIAIGITIAALLALLGYSLERTAWLFEQFETEKALAWAAAVVVEAAAVALIAGAGAIAQLDKEARAWGNRALVAVLSVQALANLSAGYLRGGRATLAQFGQADDLAAYAVAAALWFVTNLAVPVLVLCLSKLLERQIAALASLPAEAKPSEPPSAAAPPDELEEFSIERWLDSLEPTQESLNIKSQLPASNTSNTPAQDYTCRHCGAFGLTKAQQLAHGRQHARAGACGAAAGLAS